VTTPGNGVYARLDRAEKDIEKLDRIKAEQADLARLERGLESIRKEVAGLREDWRKGRETQPWTRGQKIAAVAVVVTMLIGIASMVITIAAASGT
jgi:hypothetical protein